MQALEVPILVQREIEARIAWQIYQEAAARLGDEKALSIITASVERAALEAGRAFAAQAPDGPSLEHFATIWQVLALAPGSLDIQRFQLGPDTLDIIVASCGYLALYKKMGLPPELGRALSCARDFPFARGYSPRLGLERPSTIGGGEATCMLHYQWMP